MSEIINRENGVEDLPIKRFCVSLVFVKPYKDEEGNETMELRHMMLFADGTSRDAAEWFAEKMSKEDSQMPQGYVLNSTCSMEIEPFEPPKPIVQLQ